METTTFSYSTDWGSSREKGNDILEGFGLKSLEGTLGCSRGTDSWT